MTISDDMVDLATWLRGQALMHEESMAAKDPIVSAFSGRLRAWAGNVDSLTAALQGSVVVPAANVDLDPADVWDDYCEEVATEDRSPQGALAFGFWAAFSRHERGDTTDGAA